MLTTTYTTEQVHAFLRERGITMDDTTLEAYAAPPYVLMRTRNLETGAVRWDGVEEWVEVVPPDRPRGAEVTAAIAALPRVSAASRHDRARILDELLRSDDSDEVVLATLTATEEVYGLGSDAWHHELGALVEGWELPSILEVRPPLPRPPAHRRRSGAARSELRRWHAHQARAALEAAGLADAVTLHLYSDGTIVTRFPDRSRLGAIVAALRDAGYDLLNPGTTRDYDFLRLPDGRITVRLRD